MLKLLPLLVVFLVGSVFGGMAGAKMVASASPENNVLGICTGGNCGVVTNLPWSRDNNSGFTTLSNSADRVGIGITNLQDMGNLNIGTSGQSSHIEIRGGSDGTHSSSIYLYGPGAQEGSPSNVISDGTYPTVFRNSLCLNGTDSAHCITSWPNLSALQTQVTTLQTQVSSIPTTPTLHQNNCQWTGVGGGSTAVYCPVGYYAAGHSCVSGACDRTQLYCCQP